MLRQKNFVRQQSLRECKKTGNRRGEAVAFRVLGTVFISLVEYFKAKKYHEKALVISMKTGDRRGEGACYDYLGTVFFFCR